VKVNTGVSSFTGVLISPLPNQEGDKLHSPHFMELGGSLPHSQESTTCPYPSQINPFLCPSHFWQVQLVSFLVGLRTYQHPSMTTCSLIGRYTHCRKTYFFKVPWSEKQNVPLIVGIHLQNYTMSVPSHRITIWKIGRNTSQSILNIQYWKRHKFGDSMQETDGMNVMACTHWW